MPAQSYSFCGSLMQLFILSVPMNNVFFWGCRVRRMFESDNIEKKEAAAGLQALQWNSITIRKSSSGSSTQSLHLAFLSCATKTKYAFTLECLGHKSYQSWRLGWLTGPLPFISSGVAYAAPGLTRPERSYRHNILILWFYITGHHKCTIKYISISQRTLERAELLTLEITMEEVLVVLLHSATRGQMNL